MGSLRAGPGLGIADVMMTPPASAYSAQRVPSRPLCDAKKRQITACVTCIAIAVTMVTSAGRSGATKRNPLSVPRSHARPLTLTASRPEL